MGNQNHSAALFIIREIEYSSCGSWNQLYMRALFCCWLMALGSVKALHCGGFPNVSSVRLELQNTFPSARRQLVRRPTHAKVKRHRPHWHTQTYRRGGTDWHTHLYWLSVTVCKIKTLTWFKISACFHTSASNAYTHTICLILMLHLNAAFSRI